MRRASMCLAVIGVALAALAGTASATPVVKFKAQAVPIPGYPGTGNFYGKGAAVKAEYTISGNEYNGFPPPVIGVNFYLPKGAKINNNGGFPTCATSVLEPSGQGPKACKKGSAAGPKGVVNGVVPIGGETVHETASIESFYSPGGGIEFYTFGHSPVLLEILSKGHYVNLGGGGGYGPELISEVPLVESVPGAGDASVESITVQAGSAYKKGGKTIYYGTVPKKGQCPKGGFNIKTEVIFADPHNPGTPSAPNRGETVTAMYKAPCPKH